MMSRSRSSFASHRSQEDKAEITRLNLRNIVQGSVERTIAWLNRCRQLAKDFEALTRTHLAFVQLAMIRLMMHRIARAFETSGARRAGSQPGVNAKTLQQPPPV